jgi:hypothetical protein
VKIPPSRGRSRVGVWVVSTRRAHPFAWFVLDATVGVILTAALWWAFGKTVGLAFGGFLSFMLVSGLILRLIQRRLLAQRSET